MTKCRILSLDKSKIFSTGDVSKESSRGGFIFFYEPDEMKEKFLMQIQGQEMFSVEIGSELYTVSLIEAVWDKPIKFCNGLPWYLAFCRFNLEFMPILAADWGSITRSDRVAHCDVHLTGAEII
jgi:hypothetical protein